MQKNELACREILKSVSGGRVETNFCELPSNYNSSKGESYFKLGQGRHEVVKVARGSGCRSLLCCDAMSEA